MAKLLLSKQSWGCYCQELGGTYTCLRKWSMIYQSVGHIYQSPAFLPWMLSSPWSAFYPSLFPLNILFYQISWVGKCSSTSPAFSSSCHVWLYLLIGLSFNLPVYICAFSSYLISSLSFVLRGKVTGAWASWKLFFDTDSSIFFPMGGITAISPWNEFIPCSESFALHLVDTHTLGYF